MGSFLFGSWKMDESRAYKRLKKKFPDAHWQRIEGWATVGVLDTNVCRRGIEAWIECKEAAEPKRSETLIKAKKVRPAQIAWEHDRRKTKGRTFIALMVGDTLYLLRGEHLKLIRDGVSRDWLIHNDLPYEAIFDDNYANTYASCE